jgi:hypothetical protein
LKHIELNTEGAPLDSSLKNVGDATEPRSPASKAMLDWIESYENTLTLLEIQETRP